MSTCISGFGEFSDHLPDDSGICRLCGVETQDRWRRRAAHAEAEVDALRKQVANLATALHKCETERDDLADELRIRSEDA